MWETMQVAGIAQGAVTWKGKGGKKKKRCLHLQLLSVKGMEKYMYLLMAIVETGFHVFLYRECQGV